MILSIELYLSVPKLVLSLVHINGAQQLLGSFLVVNELSLRDDTGIQYFVSTNEKICLGISK